jgi:hypothetical protein
MARTHNRPLTPHRVMTNFLQSCFSDILIALQQFTNQHPEIEQYWSAEIDAFSRVVPAIRRLDAAHFLNENRNQPGSVVLNFLQQLTDLSTSITDITAQLDLTMVEDDPVRVNILDDLFLMRQRVTYFPAEIPEVRDPPIPVPDQRRNPFAPAPLQPNAFMPAAPIAAGIAPNAFAVIPHRPLFASAVPAIPSDIEPVTGVASLIAPAADVLLALPIAEPANESISAPTGQNPAQANIAMDGLRVARAARPLPVVPVAADPQFDNRIRIHRRVTNNPLYVLDNILAMTHQANENMHLLRRRVPGATQDDGSALRRLSRSIHHLDLTSPIDATRRRLRHSYEQAILARQWVEAYIVSEDVFIVGLPLDGRRLLLQGIQPMILDITAAILQLQHIFRQR